MADLDDILGGLLADNPAKKSAPGRRSMQPSRTLPSKLSDDAFYSSLAAQADDETSDISDADPKEIAQSLGDMDDMDAALFGSKKPSSTQQKSAGAAAPTAKASPSAASKGKKMDFGDFDEDDPLAGLLSDEDDTPRQKVQAARPSAAPVTNQNAVAQQRHSANATASQRPVVQRPPTRSGKSAPEEKSSQQRHPDNDVMFGDDDDLLGGLGLGSPRRQTKSASEATHRPGGAKSVLGDLLGDADIKEQLQPPGSGQKKEFVLDRRYVKSAGEAGSGSARAKPEFTEEDMTFGAYMPSVASSRPSSQRSVRFEDDPPTAAQPSTRASSAPGPAGRRRGPGSSFLEEIIDKDGRDWLDMASGAKERPKSAGAEQSKPVKPSGNQAAASEPVDWLGLSTLGSPQSTPRMSEEAEVVTARERKPTDPPAEKAAAEQRSRSNSKSDEWLGPGKGSDHQSTSAITLDDGDWLGLNSASKGHSQSQPASSSAGDDWLGLKDEKDEAPATVDAYSEPTGPQSNSLTRRADQVFTAPASADMSSPFLWDSPSPASPQRGRRARPPPHRTQSQTSSSGGDASKGLDATLDALLQAERRPSASHSPQAQTPQAPTPTLQQQPSSSTPVALSGQQPQPQLLQLPSPQLTLQQQLRQQEEVLRQQQMEAEQQLRRLQEQQQRQFQEQQLRQLQEEQLRQQEAMQRRLAEQQTYSLQNQSIGAGLSGGITLSDNFESQVKRLELERLHLLSILDTIKQQHREEIKVIAESHKKKMQLFEETVEKREQRLQEENHFLSQQCMAKLQQAERDKQELMTIQSDREKQWQAQKDEDMQRLRDGHRHLLQDLRQEHDDALERLKRTQANELEALSLTQPHSRSLQAVIERIDDNARSLGDLNFKVESKHMSTLDEREQAVRVRDEQLKALQERLERQQHENDKERAKLQALVTRLELQLTEQTKELEEDKWRLRQKENALQTKEAALEQERQRQIAQLHHERAEVEKAREELLEEQKTILSQLHTERKALAEERAQFTVTQKMKTQQDQRDSIRNAKAEVQLESTLKAVTEQEARLAAVQEDLEREKQQLAAERKKQDTDHLGLQAEKERLEQLALEVKHRSKDIQDLVEAAAKTREEGEAALGQASKLQEQHSSTLLGIKTEMESLRAKQRQLAQERLALAKEKASLESKRNSALCLACSNPLSTTSTSGPYPTQALPLSAGAPIWDPASQHMSSAARSLSATLAKFDDNSSKVHQVSAAIQMDHSIRMWSLAANKDKEFLEEEGMFLHALKQSPYHPQSQPAGGH